MLARVRSRTAALLVGALLTAGPLALAAARPASAGSFLTDAEAEMTSLLNQHRTSVGVAPLAFSAGLQAMARQQVERMVAAGTIFHDPNLAQDANSAVPGWRLVGENVGVGPSTEIVEQAFLDSPHHRENIEEPRYTVVAVGAMQSTDGQTIFFAQEFAQWTPPAAAAASSRPVAPRPTARPAVRSAAAPVVRPTPAPVVTPAPTPVVTPAPTPDPTLVPTMSPAPLAEPIPQPRNPLQGIVQGVLGLLARLVHELSLYVVA